MASETLEGLLVRVLELDPEDSDDRAHKERYTKGLRNLKIRSPRQLQEFVADYSDAEARITGSGVDEVDAKETRSLRRRRCERERSGESSLSGGRDHPSGASRTP
jgi:hypothetical protein